MTVHACPPEDAGLMPCCDRTPFDAPRTDRMTADPNLVTCTGPRRIIGEGWTPQLAAQVAAVTARLTASAEKPTDDAPAPEGTTWDPPDPKRAVEIPLRSSPDSTSMDDHLSPDPVLTASTVTLRYVDGMLHELKAQHAAPAGNEVFRVLYAASLPVCEEIQRRASLAGEEAHGG